MFFFFFALSKVSYNSKVNRWPSSRNASAIVYDEDDIKEDSDDYDRVTDDYADSDGDVGIVCNVGDVLVELYVLRPMSGGEKVLVGRNYIKVFGRSKRSTFVHNSICDFPKLKFTGASVLPVQDYKIIKEIVKSKILKIAIFQKGTVPR